MKIIAIEKEAAGSSPQKFEPFLKQEARTLWQLMQNGIVREAYFTAEDHSAVLILECTDKNAAEEYLSRLPLVKEKLICFELHTLKPYDGFAPLFDDGKE